MTVNKFIVNGKEYERETIETFFRIYCVGCEVCKVKKTCNKIVNQK